MPTFASNKSTVTLKDFFFSDLAKSSSSKLHGFADEFVGLLLNSLPFYSLSADSVGKQSPFQANRVCTVCNIAHFLSPSAPYAIPAIDNGVFNALERWACGRTCFYLSQHMHNLYSFINKTSVALNFNKEYYPQEFYKVFSTLLLITHLFLGFCCFDTFSPVDLY